MNLSPANGKLFWFIIANVELGQHSGNRFLVEVDDDPFQRILWA
jgi:hypothetical protein